MTAIELDQYGRRWKGVFSVAAAVLVLCLLDLASFLPGWSARTASYLIGAVSLLVGIYAAKKLRDIERLHAMLDGGWLNAATNERDGAGLDDD